MSCFMLKSDSAVHQEHKKNSGSFLPESLNRIVKMLNRLCELYIDSVQAFFALLSVERDCVTFAYFVNQSADVNKNFFARI